MIKKSFPGLWSKREFRLSRFNKFGFTLIAIMTFNALSTGCMSGFQALSSFSASSASISPGEGSSSVAIGSVPTLSYLANDTALPADANVLNVKDPQFGAVGDGVHDDTGAILKAIGFGGHAPRLRAPWDANFVYLPAGTYLISDTIQKYLDRSAMEPDAYGACSTAKCYVGGLILVGAGPGKTILKLSDHNPKFADSANPKAMIFTSSSFFDPTSNYNHTVGEGNDAYYNFIESMTIDVGAGNPGAIGIDYIGNNGGAIRSVVVNDSTGVSQAGISMKRGTTGPALIENVWVNGFNTGIDVAGLSYTMNLVHIVLKNQNQFGIRSNQFSLTIENLEIIDAPQPIAVTGSEAMTVISGASIHTTQTALATKDAYANEGIASLRDVSISGYGKFLTKTVSSALVDGAFNKDQRVGESKASWSMAHVDPPVLARTSAGTTETIANWVSVTKFGAVADGDTDSTAAIRAAFNSGASTIYFPHGSYRVNANIVVPPTVKMIKGFNSDVRPCGYGTATGCNNGSVSRANEFVREQGIFQLAPTSAALVIDKLNLNNNDLGGQVGFEVTGGTQPVVARDVFSAAAQLQRNANGAPIYITNWAGAGIITAGPQPIIARQLDIENQYPAVSSNGTPITIYGMKTEGPITLVDTHGGGQTEVLGGLAYIVYLGSNAAPPMFINSDSKTLVSIPEMSYASGVNYTDIMQSTMSGVVTHTTSANFPTRVYGHAVPLLLTSP